MNNSNIGIDSFDDSPDIEYEYFKEEFEKLSGIVLNLYKEKQMKRRINTLIERKKLDGYESFLNLLRSDSNELAKFIDYITINVTEFYRTPEHWENFENIVLNELCSRNERTLKIWSCASSTGEEPYSLAMSLLTLSGGTNFKIIATDLDENVLKKARAGIYDEKAVESLPEDKKRMFFTKEGSFWKIKDEVKELVEFRKLDLLCDEYPTDCDLIVCRNILIYFTEEAKRMIYKKFVESMSSDGFLFTGNTEQIVYYKEYGIKKIVSYIYKKEK